MGYIIRVNHKALSDAAEQAKSFVSFHKTKFRMLDGKVMTLKGYWSGRDQQSFISQWHGVSEKYSVSGKLNTALRNYAKCLETASNRYKRAQADAINRANRLR